MPPVKRKAEHLATVNNDRDRISQLQAELADGQSSLNNIVHLLDFASSSNADTLEQSQIALYRVFKKLIYLGKLEKPASKEVPTITVWLRDRYSEYVKTLLAALQHKRANIQLASSVLLLRLLREDPLNPNPGQFPVDLYGRLIAALLTSDNLHESTMYNFRQDYLEPFDDLRYYFYKFVEKTASDTRQKSSGSRRGLFVRDHALSMLSKLVTMLEKDGETKFWIAQESQPIKGASSCASHRKAFSDAWLAVLRFPMSEDQYRQILSIMHKRIIPFMPKPQLLMDFFTDSYDAGGSISLLALNGLFYLMENHGLDYTRFYGKLYALFNEDTMHVRHRSRFFRLADLFLNSTHVAASLLASFIKRMSRLSLTAPPAAIVTMIPLTYNLLKKHPSLLTLIHRVPGGNEDSFSDDPFLAEESDPAMTRALESSLWEMTSLVNHFHPNVATLAKILGEPFTKPSYNLEDFLDHSYTTMTDAELKKKLKNQVATAFDKPSTLWSESEVLAF